MASDFIKTYHPKKSIQVDANDFQRFFNMGWIAQLKANGDRAQIHILEDEKYICYNRQGNQHTKWLPKEIYTPLFEHFRPGDVIEAEWLKDAKKLMIFDFIYTVFGLSSVYSASYEQRLKKLPNIIDNHVSVLSMLYSLNDIDIVLGDKNAEGLIFRDPKAYGITSEVLIRCRKKEFQDISYSNKNKGK